MQLPVIVCVCVIVCSYNTFLNPNSFIVDLLIGIKRDFPLSEFYRQASLCVKVISFTHFLCSLLSLHYTLHTASSKSHGLNNHNHNKIQSKTSLCSLRCVCVCVSMCECFLKKLPFSHIRKLKHHQMQRI